MIAGMLMVGVSCKKDAEKIINCLGESIWISIKHTADSENPKKITYTVEYTGDHNLSSSVEWTFGDGNSTTGGTTIEHTYAAAGEYELKAKVTTTSGDESCTVEPTKKITVN